MYFMSRKVRQGIKFTDASGKELGSIVFTRVGDRRVEVGIEANDDIVFQPFNVDGTMVQTSQHSNNRRLRNIVRKD